MENWKFLLFKYFFGDFNLIFFSSEFYQNIFMTKIYVILMLKGNSKMNKYWLRWWNSTQRVFALSFQQYKNKIKAKWKLRNAHRQTFFYMQICVGIMHHVIMVGSEKEGALALIFSYGRNEGLILSIRLNCHHLGLKALNGKNFNCLSNMPRKCYQSR